jgi:peptide/nickel transport system substrate-binding protein
MSKRTLSLLFFVFVFAGLASPFGAEAATPKDTLILAHVSDIATLDPAKAYDSRSYKIITNIYESLVEYEYKIDAQGNAVYSNEIKPKLAISWTQSKDGLTWTFKLRKGVKFHDGTPFTAEAVKFSLERAMVMKQGPEWYLTQCLDPEKSIRVVDEYTVEFKLTQPYAAFLNVLIEPVSRIVSPAAVKQHGGVQPEKTNDWMTNHAAGTGPFLLESWSPAKEIVMVANPTYWGTAPKLKKVFFKIIKEASNIVLLLKNGDIDMVLRGLTYKDYADLAKTPGVKLYKKEDWTEVRFSPLQTQLKPFDNKKVRQAVNYAIDHNILVEKVCYGFAKPLISPIPAGQWGHDGSLWPYKYDPQKAKALLAEAGYPNGFSTELGYPEADAERKEVALVVQGYLKNIGIDAKLEGYSWPTYLDKFWKGALPMVMGKWAPASDPDFLVTAMFHSKNQGKGGNVAFYGNTKVDELLDKAAVEVSREKRVKLYQEFQKIVIDEAPWLFLYQPMRLFALRDNVYGFGMPSEEIYRFDTIYKK